jgi:hypothetical protein
MAADADRARGDATDLAGEGIDSARRARFHDRFGPRSRPLAIGTKAFASELGGAETNSPREWIVKEHCATRSIREPIAPGWYAIDSSGVLIASGRFALGSSCAPIVSAGLATSSSHALVHSLRAAQRTSV